MFSARVPARLDPNELTVTLARLRRQGREVFDLTGSNPTQAGLPYPADLLASLSDASGLTYRAEPLGLGEAREAVAREYARRGIDVPADRIVLTASTSEAYSFLFRLLCDPGDRMLVPRPSYPLLEHLTRLDGIVCEPYAIEYHGAWSVDLDRVAAGLRRGARAVLVVSPNNPTGSFATAAEIDAIADLCAGAGAALVGDEVFADYPLGGATRQTVPVFRQARVLTFALGGLSKSVGLPQVKLGWMAVGGPVRQVAPALERLEYICDAYLSVSTPVQLAAADLLLEGAVVREAILARLNVNLAALERLAGGAPACQLLRPEGGWSAVLRVPAVQRESDLVLALLERDHVLVHPGYFFDFSDEAYLVVSLLPEPSRFETGMSRLLARVAAGGIQ